MKLVEMKCKNCGANLKVDSDLKEANCQFCGAKFKIDDEVQHLKYDDMEQSGYEFEKGKIRAREEANQERAREQKAIYQAQYEEEKRKKNLKWWILGWIFCFPIPLTILIWRSIRSGKLEELFQKITKTINIIMNLRNNDNTNNNETEEVSNK